MPQLVAFNRQWSIGSDDFVFSGSVDFLIRGVWLVVVAVVFGLFYHDLDDLSCGSGSLLRCYFIGLVAILVVTLLLAAATVHTSRQGAISDGWRRRRLPIILYIRIAFAVPEVAWNGMGTRWAFSKSEGCPAEIVMIAKGTVISGWILLFIAALSALILFNAFGGKKKKPRKTSTLRIFKRGSRRPWNNTRAWEKRCKFLFCCESGNERNANVFSTLARLCEDYFKGVDLVPTDVVAGLMLLSRKHEKQRNQLVAVTVPDDPRDKRPPDDQVDGHNIIRDRNCDINVPTPTDWMTLLLMHRYMKFALGSYGWPFYVTLTNPVLGACSLCSHCRNLQTYPTHTEPYVGAFSDTEVSTCGSVWVGWFSDCEEDQVYQDNCCQCNTAAFKKTTGIYHDDIVYASCRNQIYEIPFYVAIDRETKSVVVACRGTMSLQDVITDLVIERSPVPVEGIPEATAHSGILQSAQCIKETLEAKHIVEDAFSRAEGAQLVITGHSLGAGVAALLAILLKPKYPELKCFAFSPPGELVSPEVSVYAREFTCAVVLGDDIISRQGMLMMETLKIQILQEIHACPLPKYKILTKGCWGFCCGGQSDLGEKSVTMETSHSNQVTTSEHKLSNDAIDRENKQLQLSKSNRSSLEVSLCACMEHSVHIKDTYQPLCLPGQILHIQEIENKVYRAEWSVPGQFTEIIVSPNMLVHHFPDTLLQAIHQLREKPEHM